MNCRIDQELACSDQRLALFRSFYCGERCAPPVLEAV
jgi:hypothetical protein